MKALLVSGKKNVLFFSWLEGVTTPLNTFRWTKACGLAMATQFKKRQKPKRGTYE